MAIITNLSTCAVCQNRYGEDFNIEEIVGFPATSVGPLSEYWRFYDGSAHRACLNSWKKKEKFVMCWNGGLVADEDQWLLVITDSGDIEFKK